MLRLDLRRELLLQDSLRELGVRFAARRLHHLPHEELHQLRLTALVAGPLLPRRRPPPPPPPPPHPPPPPPHPPPRPAPPGGGAAPPRPPPRHTPPSPRRS